MCVVGVGKREIDYEVQIVTGDVEDDGDIGRTSVCSPGVDLREGGHSLITRDSRGAPSPKQGA